MSDDLLIPAAGTMLGDFAREHGQHSEAHERGYLAAGLAVLSTLVGPKVQVRWNPTHSERCHIWVMQIGQSALSHRSTIQSAMKDALKTAGAFGAEYRYEPLMRTSDAGLAALLDQSRTDEDGEVVVPDIPVGTLVPMGELAPLLGGGGRGSTYVEAARLMLLQIYDGILRSDTKQTKVPMQQTSATLVGNIVEDQFADVVGDSMMVNNGFVARWVPIVVPVSDKRFSQPMTNGAVVGRSQVITRHMSQLGKLVRGISVVDNIWENATTDAHDLRATWYADTHPDDRDWSGVAEHHRGALATVWGRWQATSIKLAALHAVSRQLHDVDDLGAVVIDTVDVTWGIAMIEMAGATLTARLPEYQAQSTRGRVEEGVLRYLGKKGEPVKLNRITDGLKSGKAGSEVTRSDVREAITALAQVGEVEVTESEDGAKYVALAG